MNGESKISVPVRTSQFLGLANFLRDQGSDRDPVSAIETAIDYWIDNASWKQEDLLPEIFQEPPRQHRAYIWKEISLPHGTDIRMRYKRQDNYAKVDGDQIIYQGEVVSPSELANRISGTSRNAWRDLWIKRPDDRDWHLADDLRSKKTWTLGTTTSITEKIWHKRGYRDDIIEALSEFNTGKAHRSNIIKRVYQIRKERGDTLPKAFEETVQQTFERHCGESDIFCGNSELDLFCWPEGKWDGTWGINSDAVERYRRSQMD